MYALTFALTLAAAAPAADVTPAPASNALHLSALPDDDALADLLLHNSPQLADVGARLGSDLADVDRAQIWQNPQFSVGLNNIAIVKSNPAGLNPITDTANVPLSLSQTFDALKRGPRTQAARHAFAATTLEVQEQVRQRTFDLLVVIGNVAAAEAAAGSLLEVAEGAAALADLEQQRASHGDIAGLDADRARVDADKAMTAVGETRVQLQQALLDCASLAGVPCEPFGDPAKADAYLDRVFATHVVTEGESLALRALDERSKSAEAALQGANLAAVPDPTISASYTHDQLVIAGNQPDTLSFDLSIPLPVFDRGQADARQAKSALESFRVQRMRTTAQLALAQKSLVDKARSLEARRQKMDEQTVPLVRSLVEKLKVTVEKGGAPLQDLLLARQSLSQVLVDKSQLDLELYNAHVELARNSGLGPHAIDLAANSTP